MRRSFKGFNEKVVIIKMKKNHEFVNLLRTLRWDYEEDYRTEVDALTDGELDVWIAWAIWTGEDNFPEG